MLLEPAREPLVQVGSGRLGKRVVRRIADQEMPEAICIISLEHRPIGTGNEVDRIILYLPSRLLDLAEVLAGKAGVPAIQDYCARLLAQAIEAEQPG